MGVVILVVGFVLALLAIAFARVISPKASPSPEWFENFTLDRYRPMERLLSEDDFRFLALQPGYTPAVARQLRRDRRTIFRQYLRSLSRDFSRLLHVARVMMLFSPDDQMQFQVALWRLRLQFLTALAIVHLKLALHGAGLGTVDASAVVGVLRSMHQRVDRMVPHTIGI